MDQDVALLTDLTPDQRDAVTHGTGPLLVLAGAGSGKTRVITRRVAHLLDTGVSPRSILAITFTNKAAGEMRQRVDQMVPGHRVWISTFHSFGARLLREYADRVNFDRNFTIYDTDDRKRLLKDVLEMSGIDNVKFSPDRIGGAISKAKNQLQSPQEVARGGEDGGSNYFTETIAEIYAAYEKRLRDANAADFDDLLYLPALALRHDPELRAELDARFQYILIDEYQDTNPAQYEIVRQLSIDHPNICVVGDPDQSIYKWRNADIKNILNFERDFPDTRVITLDLNYRSTKAVLRAADALIEHNTQRKPKTLVTDNPEGDPVRILTYDTGLDEADLVVKRIQDEVKAGKRRYRDYAIFMRVNALSRTLESAFVKHAVPFQIVRGLAFFERKENRDVLAYLRLLVNPQDNLSFLRAVNEPSRGIGKVSLQRLQEFAEPREMSLLAAAAQVDRIPEIRGKAKNALRQFAKMIGDLRQYLEHPPEEVIRHVLDKSGFREMYQESSDPEDEERLENIEEMITAASQFTAEDESRTIGDFLEQITLASDVDSWDERADCVSAMTLHAAKGLEFPVVYILAVEQGLLPHERSIAKLEDLEEERRLCFVGMTRAMHELNLCHGRLREFRGQALYALPSQFIDELMSQGIQGIEAEDLSRHAGRSAFDSWRGGGSSAAQSGWADTGIDPRSDPSGYHVGMVVEHERYGRGQITQLSGFGALRRMKIRFQTAGEKTFVVEKVKLQIVEE